MQVFDGTFDDHAESVLQVRQQVGELHALQCRQIFGKRWSAIRIQFAWFHADRRLTVRDVHAFVEIGRDLNRLGGRVQTC